MRTMFDLEDGKTKFRYDYGDDINVTPPQHRAGHERAETDSMQPMEAHLRASLTTSSRR